MLERYAGAVVVDGGDSLSLPHLDGGDVAPARIKADLVGRAWALGGIDAIALSERDWQLGAEHLRALVARHSLPVLAGNLVCGDEQPWPGHKVVERDGLRIGIVGVTAGSVDGCEVGAPGPAIEASLAALGEVDVTIALVPLGRRELRELSPPIAADLTVVPVPADRLVIGSTVPMAPRGRGKTLGVAKVDLVVGGQGLWSPGRREALLDDLRRAEQRLGELRSRREGLEPERRAAIDRQIEFHEKRVSDARAAYEGYGDGVGRGRVDVREIELDDTIADDPAVAALLKETLARLDALVAAPPPDTAAPRLAEAGRFLGVDGCRGCHPAESAQWDGTGHARAFQALVDDGHARDPSCVGCHVTGWKTDGGASDVAGISALRDVQCEACHGPGRAHAADPVQVRVIRDPELATCTACHDGDRDGGRFDADTYRPRIVHP